MSDKNNLLIEKFEQLKNVFTSTFSSQATEVVSESFATVKTAEGVELTIEGELAVGSKVTMKDTSGQLVPAPEGAHTLEDGTVIVIANGAISEINPKAEAPEIEVKVEQTAADFTTQINTISEVLNSLTARIEGIEKTVASQAFAKVEDLNSIKEVVTKTYAVVEGLVNTPAAAVENKFSTNKRADKINELRNLLNN